MRIAWSLMRLGAGLPRGGSLGAITGIAGGESPGTFYHERSHRMTLDLFGFSRKADPKRIAEVKKWVAEVFRLGADVSVMVTELHCTEAGCPPLETVIAILDQPGQPRQFKIHKAIADVAFADVLHVAKPKRSNCPTCDCE